MIASVAAISMGCLAVQFWYDARWWRKRYGVIEAQLQTSLAQTDELLLTSRELIEANARIQALLDEAIALLAPKDTQ